MKISLEGRTVLVCGGSGGIGRAVLKACQEAGARTVNMDLHPPTPAVGNGSIYLEADVSNPAAVQAAVDQAVEQAGPIEHVIFCAGITRDRVLWKLTDDQWSTVLNVNLTGAFNLLRATTAQLRKRRGTSVVLVASINGERGKRGQANYAASKGGLIAFGKTAARELGHFGVRVNVVNPGLITQTAMTNVLPIDVVAKAHEEAALGREGRPEDVANAVLFLISDLAAHITGQVLRVDGGQLIC